MDEFSEKQIRVGSVVRFKNPLDHRRNRIFRVFDLDGPVKGDDCVWTYLDELDEFGTRRPGCSDGCSINWLELVERARPSDIA